MPTQTVTETRNLEFLLRATGAMMGDTSDARGQLQSLARLVVPELADWCSIDVVGEDALFLENVAVAHVDPRRVDMAHRLRRRYPASMADPNGVGQVIRSGQPMLMPEIPDELIAQGAIDAEHLALMRQLQLKSILCLPLTIGHETFGTLSLIGAESGRRYGPEDLALGMELAHRAAQSIHSARLVEKAEEAARDREAALEQARRANEDLELRVRRRTQELTAANQELEAFSYSVSHDLRAPLRAIAGFAQALQEESGAQLDAQGQTDLTRIRSAAARMGELIDDLLMLSQCTSAGLQRREVDLSQLAESVVEELRAREPQREMTVRVAAGMKAFADPRLMHIVLENLIGNAFKFTRGRAPGQVEVGQARDQPPTFFVRDDGAGFDMANAGRLFQPFSRLHAPRDFEGSGVGLATARRIIARHGGSIWAESAPNAGATFSFSL